MISSGDARLREVPSPHTGSAGLVDCGEPPLVVDVDGTLLRTDLLWEGPLTLAFRRPAHCLESSASFRAARRRRRPS